VSHDLTAPEIRVLGCLLEKQRLTPDVYPLTLNALRAACNQATNRDPVVHYDDDAIRDALQRLGHRRFTRLASYHGSRAAKYRHLLDDTLGLRPPEQAVLCVLMLRGPQTPGELRQRTERLHRFATPEDLDETLEELTRRDLVVRLERRPGQKEARHAHLLGGDVEDVAPPAPAAPQPPPAVTPSAPAAERPAPAPAQQASAAPDPARDARLTRLEAEVAELRAQVAEIAELRAQLDALRAELGVV
jgi:uncharacterized protein